MLAYIPRRTTATTRTGTLEHEYKATGGGKTWGPITEGMIKVETTGKELFKECDVLGKLFQKENPIYIHDGRKREGTG